MGYTSSQSELASYICQQIIIFNTNAPLGPSNTFIRDLITAFGLQQVYDSILASGKLEDSINTGGSQNMTSLLTGSLGYSLDRLLLCVDSTYYNTHSDVISIFMGFNSFVFGAAGSPNEDLIISLGPKQYPTLASFIAAVINAQDYVLNVAPASSVKSNINVVGTVINCVDLADITQWTFMSNNSSSGVFDVDLQQIVTLYYCNASNEVITTAILNSGGVAPFTNSRYISNSDILSQFKNYFAAGNNIPTPVARPTQLITTTASTTPLAVPIQSASTVISSSIISTYNNSLSRGTTITAGSGWMDVIEESYSYGFALSLQKYMAITINKTVDKYYSAGFSWQELIFNNIQLSLIKSVYSITPSMVWTFVGQTDLTGLAINNGSGAVSQIPNVINDIQLQAVFAGSGPYSTNFVQIFVLYKLGYDAPSLLVVGGSVQTELINSANTGPIRPGESCPAAQDFDLIYSGYIASLPLLNRLCFLDTVSLNRNPRNELLLTTDTADDIFTTLFEFSGLGKLFTSANTLAPITVSSIGLPLDISVPDKNTLLADSFIIEVINLMSSTNIANTVSGLLGPLIYTINSFMPDGTTWDSSFVTILARNYYIDSSNMVQTRGVTGISGSPDLYTSLSSTNRELVIRNLANNNNELYLNVVLLEFGTNNQSDAIIFVEKLVDIYGLDVIMSLSPGGWSNDTSPVILFMENSFMPGYINNSKKILDYSINQLALVRYAYNNMDPIIGGNYVGNDSARISFVSLCVRRGLDASLLANVIGSTTAIKLNEILNAMSADDSSVYLAYSDILHLFAVKDIMDPLSNFPDIVSANGMAISSGFAGGAVSAASALVGVNGFVGIPTGNADTFWFLCFTSLLDITAFAQLSVADPATLLSYIKTVPLFDFTTMTFVANGFLGNSKQFIFNPLLIQQAYELSNEEIKQAIRDSGVNVTESTSIEE